MFMTISCDHTACCVHGDVKQIRAYTHFLHKLSTPFVYASIHVLLFVHIIFQYEDVSNNKPEFALHSDAKCVC